MYLNKGLMEQPMEQLLLTLELNGQIKRYKHN